jgi:hypothetical protein
MKYQVKMTRIYTTYFEIDATSNADALKQFDEMNSDDKYNRELEQMNVDEGRIAEIDYSQHTKWARKCSVTGKGMNEGFCFADGQDYAIDEESALKLAKEYGHDTLKEAYEDDVYYYTEWEDEDDYQYVEIDGNVIDIDEL